MAKSHTPKDVRKLDRLARQNGFILVRQGRHLVYRHPKIREQLAIAKSASDNRACKNNMARLKRLMRTLEGESASLG